MTVTKWQITKLVPLSLIVGSAGGAFLSAMQSRIDASVNAAKLDTAREVATRQLDQVEEAAKKQLAHAAGVEPNSIDRATIEQAGADSITGAVQTAKAAIGAV
jgi:hypothetical protein